MLNNRAGYRIAVIVNDMASVNIDAELVRRGGMMQKEEKMVELSNGCICCTLREDLLTSLSSLASEKRFDHVLVESSGISEPLPVAETFTFRDNATGVALQDVASLHNLVTVVDAASIFEQLNTMDTLVDRGWHEVDGDKRTVSHLLCDQLEFANLLLVNKCDLITEAESQTLKAFLRKVNPTAEVICTEQSVLAPSALLDKGRFSMQTAEAHPMWLKEAREHEHTPETVEYGISSFVFRAKRPFHPERLYAAMEARPRPGALAHLLRLKGFAWLATQPMQQAHAALAGTRFTMSPGPPWWAAVPQHQWPAGLIEEFQAEEFLFAGGGADGGVVDADAAAAAGCTWDAEHGDRRTELVCIGRELDHGAAQAQLESCLLTPEEMEAGCWFALPDPFGPAWRAMGGNAGGGGHAHGGGEAHHHDHTHTPRGAGDERVERLAADMSKGATEANLRGVMELARDHGVPAEHLIGFVFSYLSEEAPKQIKECAPVLRDIFASSDDKRRMQRAVLKGVTDLVTAPQYGERMLKKTPLVLMALYDIDLIEESVVLKWHAKVPDDDDDEGKKVRAAAAPFVKWLNEAEVEEDHNVKGKEGFPPVAS